MTGCAELDSRIILDSELLGALNATGGMISKDPKRTSGRSSGEAKDPCKSPSRESALGAAFHFHVKK
jgi:hypothetical protein